MILMVVREKFDHIQLPNLRFSDEYDSRSDKEMSDSDSDYNGAQ